MGLLRPASGLWGQREAANGRVLMAHAIAIGSIPPAASMDLFCPLPLHFSSSDILPAAAGGQQSGDTCGKAPAFVQMLWQHANLCGTRSTFMTVVKLLVLVECLFCQCYKPIGLAWNFADKILLHKTQVVEHCLDRSVAWKWSFETELQLIFPPKIAFQHNARHVCTEVHPIVFKRS